MDPVRSEAEVRRTGWGLCWDMFWDIRATVSDNGHLLGPRAAFILGFKLNQYMLELGTFIPTRSVRELQALCTKFQLLENLTARWVEAVRTGVPIREVHLPDHSETVATGLTASSQLMQGFGDSARFPVPQPLEALSERAQEENENYELEIEARGNLNPDAIPPPSRAERDAMTRAQIAQIPGSASTAGSQRPRPEIDEDMMLEEITGIELPRTVQEGGSQSSTPCINRHLRSESCKLVCPQTLNFVHTVAVPLRSRPQSSSVPTEMPVALVAWIRVIVSIALQEGIAEHVRRAAFKVDCNRRSRDLSLQLPERSRFL